jgi:hypothetical protein
VKSWGETVIAVVADGVGAALAGKEASKRAVRSLVSNYAERPRTWSPQKSLAEFTRLLNQRLYQDSIARFGAVLHRFIKEQWNATRLKAEFFPKAFVPENCTTRCYAMEFIEAPSLKTLLRSRRLSVAGAIS